MIEEKYLLSKIKKCPKVYQKYTYDNEESVNPFYYDLEHSPSLCVGESRIWALRTDLILAVGIKNAYDTARGSTIFDRADASVHHYINQHDRYGHPSLITPYDGYDGSVYIAGWVYQHEDHLEIILWSGRYSNSALTQAESQNIEQYVSLQFMKAWGEQKILFLCAINEHLLTLFFQGKLNSSITPYRSYNCVKSIQTEVFYNCIINFEIDYTLKMLSTYPYLKDEDLDSKGNTVFWLFSEQGHELGLNLLKKLGVDINQTKTNNETALHIAAREGNYNLVRLLIFSGASQILLNSENQTPVEVAKDNAIKGFFETDIVCMRVDEILSSKKIVTKDIVGLIVTQFYSMDELNSFRLLYKCKESVTRNCPHFIKKYESQLEEQLIIEREKGLKLVIKYGYTFRAVNMLCNEYSDLVNMEIDENGNTPLIYFALKKDIIGVGWLLMFNGVDINISNNFGYTFKDYLALSTKEFIDSLDYFSFENTHIKLFILQLKSLFSFEKNLDEYILWSRSSPINYYLFSIFAGADLYKEAKKLSSKINTLRLNWSDEKYFSLKDDYRKFCIKSGTEYYPENFVNDELTEVPILGN